MTGPTAQRPRVRFAIVVALSGSAILLAVWLSFAGRGSAPAVPPSPRAGSAESPMPRADAQPVVVADGVENGALPQPAREAVTAAAANTPSAEALLRARCVDTNGVPRSCRASLRLIADEPQRRDRWLREHGTASWPEQLSMAVADDGMVRFTFWPPPPCRIELRLERAGCCASLLAWQRIEPGADIDAGDVVMQPGVRVTGRVLDATGLPLPGLAVLALVEKRVVRTRSDAFGAFRFDEPLPWGFDDWLLARPVRLDRAVPAELPAAASCHVELVAVEPAASSMILGRVLDEADEPAAGALVRYRGDGPRDIGRTTADDDGAFVLVGQRLHAATAAVTAMAIGCEPTPAPVDVVWGTTDVVLRIRRGGQVIVRVTDVGERLVGSYTAWMLPRGKGLRSSEDDRIRASGQHQDGRAVIPDIATGVWWLVVEFARGSQLAPIVHELEVAQPVTHIDLQAEPFATRALRLMTSAGAPIRGASVQLCDPVEGVLDARTFVADVGSFCDVFGRERALSWQVGSTDDEGRLLLRGPGRRSLGLVLPGPGHLPAWRTGISLLDAAELVITLPVGAALVGRLTPPVAWAEFQQLVAAADAPPHLKLVAVSPDSSPNREPSEIPVGEDAGFRKSDLLPGTYEVELCYDDRGDRRRPLGTVNLSEGRTTRFDPDISALQTGTVLGKIVHNGAAPARGQVLLAPRFDAARAGGRSHRDYRARLDEQGRFTFRGPAGVYDVDFDTWHDNVSARLAASDSLLVLVGQTTRQTFSIASGWLEVTVLDPRGEPLRSVELHAAPAAVPATELDYTDEEGKVRAMLLPGPVDLLLLPERLLSEEAFDAYLSEAEGRGATAEDAHLAALMVVGSTRVVAGETARVVVRLTQEWAR